MIDGSYDFTWRNFQRDDIASWVNSGLVIRNGILYYIAVFMNRFFSLQETLDTVGHPDTVRIDIGPYGIPRLRFIYIEPRLEISMKAKRVDCNVRNISTLFWINEIAYYSPEAWEDLEIAQSASDNGIYDVPPETWAAWLNGEVDLTCREAWEQLAIALGEAED
jgi:hypothetical protein